ncbi:hypothetical protein ETU10_03305 [Apibacter muscae]|uniref:hypothetical protein n=1 Tax=Apibacter muscae TaxID=2509004 RepID=UPI0011ADCA24|nr:hypothetical protein [Apibacter muscae]TWP24285.1 hypothetical protein ETU10_03305 [Apibacter muscae]
MINKCLKSLEELRQPNFNSDSDIKIWKNDAIVIIDMIYGEGSKYEEQIIKKHVNISLTLFGNIDNK